MNLPVLNIPQRRNAVFNAVQRHVGILRRITTHRFQNAAGRREKPGAASRISFHVRFQFDPFRFQPVRQFLKGQHRVYGVPVVGRFILLCNTRPDKDGLGFRHSLFDIGAMGLHRRQHIRQIFQFPREILLDQQIDAVAAGGNQNVPVLFLQHAVIFPFDLGRAQRGFFRIRESQLLQAFPHAFDADAVVVGDKGRCKRRDDRGAALNQHLHLFGLINDFLRVLGTDNKAVSAENAFVSDDMRLVPGKTDGFHRTVPDTFVAVFTVGFLQCQAVLHACPSPVM